ncbi:MAG TPA: hypothetical protein VKR06_02000 [Ktedonosporobacter sp.]|nr:hypothetical protein [Ktedonosporobacter sp.]
MSSLGEYCGQCGATNDPGRERCSRCDSPLTGEKTIVQPKAGPRPFMPRRAALWTLLAGIAALPVGAGAAYLAYLKLTDPHLLTYTGHHTTAQDAAWSPDGTRIASSGWLDGETGDTGKASGNVQIWNAMTGQTLHTCRVEQPVQGIFPLEVHWSRDGKYVLAFVGSNRQVVMAEGSCVVETVQIWDAETGQRVRSIPMMEPVTTNTAGTDTDRPLVSKWALNERYVAAVNEQDQAMVEIWEMATGGKIARLQGGPASRVQEMTWSRDLDKLALRRVTQDTTHERGNETLEIWKIAPLSKIATKTVKIPQTLVQVNWTPDGRALALVLENGARIYEIWDVLTGKRLQTFQPTDGETRLVGWSPKGNYLVLEQGLTDEIYESETGKKLLTYEVHRSMPEVVWSPDSTSVALVDDIAHGVGFSSHTYPLLVLSVSSGRQRAKYEDDSSWFHASTTAGKLVWSPDGKYLLVVGRDINIWRAEEK